MSMSCEETPNGIHSEWISKTFNRYTCQTNIFKEVERLYSNLHDKLQMGTLIAIHPHKLKAEEIVQIQPMANPYEISIDFRSPILEKIPYKQEIFDMRKVRNIDCRTGMNREGKATAKYLRSRVAQQPHFDDAILDECENLFDVAEFMNTETNDPGVTDVLKSKSKTSLDLSKASTMLLTMEDIDEIAGQFAGDLNRPVTDIKRNNPHISELEKEFDDLMKNLAINDDHELLETSLLSNLDSFSQDASALAEDRPVEGKSNYEYATMVDISLECTEFERIRGRMAHIWPFELDTFQKHAITILEDRQSVLVSAHTSAGKTVVAEYAIALAFKHMTRVVYTSPIKALSNQKFRQFKQTFTDVGIITGDVQVNRSASCVVMTTEILRSMLFNGDRMVHNLEYVIFDEVHYINDSQRGVIWEEVLILLPNYVIVVLLSASVPNAMDFAEWVGSIKNRRVFVVGTLNRPVPLKPYIFVPKPLNNNHFVSLQSKKDAVFDSSRFCSALEALREEKRPQQNWVALIDLVSTNNDTPMVIFCFSKKRIRQISISLVGKICLCSEGESHRIHVFLNRALQRLQECDRELPQIHYMRSILKCGIGVHHSGILPIMKECVEMLFECGLVKVLFATDTFSMGVNMPAKTVFFESITKFEGTGMRMLLPGEYLQMAGRAGRRGMDTVGKVIISLKQPFPQEQSIRALITGSACLLQSRFRLTYGTLLNLLKTGDMNVGDVIRLSFSDFGVRTCLVKLGKQIKLLEGNNRSTKGVSNCRVCMQDIREFANKFSIFSKEMAILNFVSLTATSVFVPGRVIIVKFRNKNCLGLVLTTPAYKTLGTTYQITCLVFPPGHEKTVSPPAFNGNVDYFKVNTIGVMSDLSVDNVIWIGDHLLSINASVLIKNFRKRSSRFPEVMETQENLYQYAEKCNFNIPFLNKLKRDISLKKNIQSLRRILTDLSQFKCTGCCHFGTHFKSMVKIIKNEDDLAEVRGEYRQQEESLDSEYNSRLEVLKTLNYVSSSGVVEIKGNFARILNHMELFFTELAVQGVLSLLEPEDLVAVMSVLIYEGKAKRISGSFSLKFESALLKMMKIANKIDVLQDRLGVVDQYEYIAPRLNDGLSSVAYSWALGVPFADVMCETEEDEGIVVRCIQRVHETLLDFHSACRSVGDFSLSAKILEASRIINRDIVFTGSLYVE